MSNGSIEHTNLEAHVELCTQRFKRINERLDNIEAKLDQITECMTRNGSSTIKTVIYSAGTVIAGLLSTIVVMLMKL